MLRQLRQSIIHHLWHEHRKATSQMALIEQHFLQHQIKLSPLDHFAIIDLPGPHSGIPTLTKLFSLLGYEERGKGYLPDKQNDFLWMADADSMQGLAIDALPQAVVADFRPTEMPAAIAAIISKYAQQSAIFPLQTATALAARVQQSDEEAYQALFNIITTYLNGRDWPLPTKAEFYQVREFNELLSWVLVFGRRLNHFTLSVHLMPEFSSLESFHTFISEEVQLQLNHEGGIIKGGSHTGIAQGSTVGTPQTITLADGTVELPAGFVEFVWRYPARTDMSTPPYWDDYFTGFVAQHANHVIESLCIDHG